MSYSSMLDKQFAVPSASCVQKWPSQSQSSPKKASSPPASAYVTGPASAIPQEAVPAVVTPRTVKNHFTVSRTYRSKNTSGQHFRPDLDQSQQKFDMVNHRRSLLVSWCSRMNGEEHEAASMSPGAGIKIAALSFLEEVVKHHRKQCTQKALYCRQPTLTSRTAALLGARVKLHAISPEDELRLYRLRELVQKLADQLRRVWKEDGQQISESQVERCWNNIRDLHLFQDSALMRAEDILFEME